MGDILIKFIGKGNEILILSLLIILGLIFARLVKKIKLPEITGYILAGFVIGDPLLHLISPRNFESLQNINLVALGLMSITIGAHLNFHKLKNSGKRVISVLLFESGLSFSFVFFAIYLIGQKEFMLSLLIASISIATAPAATVATVKEIKAKGLVVNTLMPVVAINNVLCIIVFGIIADAIALEGDITFYSVFTVFGKEFVISVILGIMAGMLLKYFAEKSISSNGQVLTLVFLTVLATTGVSTVLKINSMLPCMVIGIVITNTSRYRSTILTIFEEIEYLIMIIFFALAGAHIDLDSIGIAGFIGLVYFFARGFGKIIGASVGADLAQAPRRVARFIGPTLLPQAGVAIGLIIMAGSMPELESVMDFLTTLVLAVVALNEIVGPPVTKWALTQSGDAWQDRPKLIEFLLEEYINPNLKARTKDKAIRELISFFIKSHHGTKALEDQIVESVFLREAEASTGIGNGVAIPHGLVDEGPVIWGALGLSREGIDLILLTGNLFTFLVLIVTPKNHKADMHLAVLSQLSKILGGRNTLEKIFASETAAEICEIFTEKEKKDFNYFLDNS